MNLDPPDVGPWAKEKLACLRNYLHAYTTVMKEQARWCKGYVYVDAFAGAGTSRIRKDEVHEDDREQLELTLALDTTSAENEADEYIDGSPRVALTLQYPFTHYVFVEVNPDRVAALEQLRMQFSDPGRIAIRQTDCNRYLIDKVVRNPQIDWQVWRGVVFLDPFGMQVPWTTIELLGSTKAIEVIINLPVGMAIQRLLKRSGEFTQSQRAKLDSYFGSSDWFEIVYQETTGLFEATVDKYDHAAKRLVNWYRERLEGDFGFASTARLIRSPQGHHLYYLVWAGPNQTGLRVADHILRQGEHV